MLKEYVCPYCLGKGEVDDSEHGFTQAEGQPAGVGVWWAKPRTAPCPSCAEKHFPPRVTLPFEGPPATRELVVEATATVQFDDCYECHEAKGVGAVCSKHGDPWKKEEK